MGSKSLKELAETSNNFIDACSPTDIVLAETSNNCIDVYSPIEIVKFTTQLSLSSSRSNKFTIIKHRRISIDSSLKRYQQFFHEVASFSMKSLESNKDMKILAILKNFIVLIMM